MTPERRKILLIIVGILALCAAVYAFLQRDKETTDAATIEAHVVTLSARVPGYVHAVTVRDNQRVKAGDVVAEIDPRDYQLRLDRATALAEAVRAQYDAAKSTFAATQISAPSGVDSAISQVASARAEYDRASSELRRVNALDRKSVTRKQIEEAIAAEARARSQLTDAQARLRTAKTAPNTVAVAESAVEQLAAQVRQAEADMAQAKKDLDDTRILAPIDGRIAKRTVEPGMYAQTGEALAAVVSNTLWVVANFKETQLTHMRPGQKVDIRVDAMPSLTLKGTVESIQAGTGGRFSTFPPENATGNFVKIVQRVPVKIVLDSAPDASLPIGPGMSVVPTVHVQ